MESTGPSVEEVLYEVNWVLRPSSKTLHVANHTCRWIILADRTGLGSALAQQLEAFGYTATLCCFDSFDLADFQLLLTAEPLAGILHLWALDVDSMPVGGNSDSQEDLAEALQQRSCGSLLQLLQQLNQFSPANRTAPKIWVVTRGAQQVPGLPTISELAPLQAPLWGMGRVASLEFPNFWGGAGRSGV